METEKNNPNKQRLRIGIILAGKECSKEINSFIVWCLENQNLELCCLVYLPLKNKKMGAESFIQKIFWKLILNLESLLTKLAGKKEEALLGNPSNWSSSSKIFIGDLEDKNSKEFQLIEGHKLDLFVAFDLNPCSLKLRNRSKLGLLGFEIDSSYRSIYPDYFKEVLEKKNKTKFKIAYILPKNLGAKLIFDGSFVTHGLFLANHKNVIKRRNFYMQKILMRIYQEQDIDGKSISLESLAYKIIAPSIIDQTRYLIHIANLIKNKVLNFAIGKKDSWNVGLSFSDWKIFNINESTIIKNPKNHYLADPFIVTEKSGDFCFVEDYDWAKSKGVIAAYQIIDGIPIRLGKVLEEPFHLSFPYIFRHGSKLYMLPESADNMDIRLYECLEFPKKWKLKKVVMDDVSAADSMIFQFNGLWWLFSNVNPIGERDCCSELSIFYSSNPIDGKWTPHENNPVIFDPSSARNGGIIFENNDVYRIGQNQAFGTYGGDGISINKIIELTPSRYEEKSVLTISPDSYQGVRGAHHMHSEGGITAFDFLK